MKIIFEDKDYIKALTPDKYGGCSFKLVIDNNKYMIDIGCHCLVNLLTEADHEFWKLWKRNNEKPFNIDITPALKIDLLNIEPCTKCGGTIFKAKE